ncbi:MBL fold metallo-hydrolase [Roseivirga sp. BDSF3-8]|uniref:MBL fold metallo-hydrolase n=1 Tax=Roseivirga sp. BDSF3-8 TaxID=3241598 RepID=UPI003531BBBB
MLRIHHIRNATMAIETEKEVILVDPMLGPAGSFPPFTFIRHKPRKNPVVPFPEDSRKVLDKVTHCLITHRHIDHLDGEGEAFLKKRAIPVTCSVKDEELFRKKGLNVTQALAYRKPAAYLGGTIEGIPARHGYGIVYKMMGNVMGFLIRLPGQPSIYVSSDTIYTDEVKRVLEEERPDISVVAAGGARMDILQPLLMRKEDVIRFVRDAPGKVIANHLEAVNHCPVSREELGGDLNRMGLHGKALIPADGEIMRF